MTAAEIRRFRIPGLRGEMRCRWSGDGIDGRLQHLLDPGRARKTLHWGRNYLYVADWRTPAGEEFSVVVKQFRHETRRRKLDRRFRGSKGERSWRVALALEAAGLPTPEPVLWAESEHPEGPAYYVSRYRPDLVEARDFVRALNAGETGTRFAGISRASVLATLGELAHGLHEAGFWHRDYSAGNVLLDLDGDPISAYLVDLNRTRRPRRVSLGRRMRDLCRMPLEREEDQSLLLAAYFRGEPPRRARRLYRLYHRAFHGRHRWKRRLRGRWKGLRDLLIPRKAYPHLPSAPPDASRRDRAVWDHLSDQPHQHAGRWDKLVVRMRDTTVHLRTAQALLTATPSTWRAYRRLRAGLYRNPTTFGGLGVCVRPWPSDPEALLAALDDLGVRDVLLRLHPWEEDHQDEERLARDLHSRGYRLAFALPQRRELVRDLESWRAAVEELVERFLPFGRSFQVGQAINRSKWGLWNLAEYQELAGVASEVLRRHPGAELVGPAVIDFELHYTAAVLNWPGSELRFDAVGNLLYVDRRGAPENPQAGFATVGKVVLAHAIATAGRRSAPRTWVTEVNWPLREGPHAPAGRHVAVDESTAADYLARYYLLTLGTGLVERVYWWQLVARGYGLTVAEDEGLRRRPAYRALQTLVRLEGSTFLGPLACPEGTYLYPFRRGEGPVVLAGWTRREPSRIRLPRPAASAWDRDGAPLDCDSGGVRDVEIGPSVRYFELEG